MTEIQSQTNDGLVALVHEQIALYDKLDSLSQRQHVLVETDDTDGLLAVLGQRQQLIEHITDAASRMAPFRARWDEHVRELKDSQRETLRKGLDDLSAVMAIIADRDDADRRSMESRREVVREKISGVKRGTAAVSAYGGVPVRGPRFQDRKA